MLCRLEFHIKRQPDLTSPFPSTGINFQTLLRAPDDGNLALIECADAATREPCYVICAVGRDPTDFVVTPFGHLADGNPYEDYLPPSATLPNSPPA